MFSHRGRFRGSTWKGMGLVLPAIGNLIQKGGFAMSVTPVKYGAQQSDVRSRTVKHRQAEPLDPIGPTAPLRVVSSARRQATFLQS